MRLRGARAGPLLFCVWIVCIAVAVGLLCFRLPRQLTLLSFPNSVVSSKRDIEDWLASFLEFYNLCRENQVLLGIGSALFAVSVPPLLFLWAFNDNSRESKLRKDPQALSSSASCARSTSERLRSVSSLPDFNFLRRLGARLRLIMTALPLGNPACAGADANSFSENSNLLSDGSAPGLSPIFSYDLGSAEVEAKPEEEVKKVAEKAAAYKKCGNDLFAKNEFHAALQAYTKAINTYTDNLPPSQSAELHVCHSNRAICHLKLENFGSAIIDAEAAIKLQPNFSKAYYRRGCAYLCLLRYNDALKDFQKAFKLGGGKGCADRVRECQKQIREQKFAAAISLDKTKPPSETVDISAIEVPDSYKGPVFRKDPAFFTELIDYIKEPGNVLHKRYAYQIVVEVLQELKQSPTLVNIQVPNGSKFTICGDVHGQFYDLLNILKMNGNPSGDNPYLFNGDFVDRGSFSVECILTLYAAKLIWPDSVHLARGNHETRNMNKLYGFEGEVTAKYDGKLYDIFCETFCALPLAHVINGQIFAVHGGLASKDGVTLQDINNIDRFCEPPDDGLMSDLLWADPQVLPGRMPSKRGIACAFGPDVTTRFLKENKLKMIVRSHEMKEEGYSVEHDGKLITVFSAPNYCDQMGNKGAFIRLKAPELKPDCVSFSAVSHPPVRPMQYANPFLAMM